MRKYSTEENERLACIEEALLALNALLTEIRDRLPMPEAPSKTVETQMDEQIAAATKRSRKTA